MQLLAEADFVLAALAVCFEFMYKKIVDSRSSKK
jgi:hypothetical protein